LFKVIVLNPDTVKDFNAESLLIFKFKLFPVDKSKLEIELFDNVNVPLAGI